MDIPSLIERTKFNEQGLVPVVTQEFRTGEVLMLAWMSRDAMELTLTTGQVYYWSRSREALWRKGETSGNVQELKEFYLDCDCDSVLIKVEQTGPACHTGERTCFFTKVK